MIETLPNRPSHPGRFGGTIGDMLQAVARYGSVHILNHSFTY
jgi:hypothetical protein